MWRVALVALLLAGCGGGEMGRLRTEQYNLREDIRSAEALLELQESNEAGFLRLYDRARADALEGADVDPSKYTEDAQRATERASKSRAHVADLRARLEAVERQIAALGERP